MDELCCSSLLDEPMDVKDAEEFAHVLKALADPVRLRLVSIVAASGEVCACDLPAMLERSQPTVSHHLSQLVKAGVLRREQRGKWAWFSVDAQRVSQIRDILA